MDLFVITSPHTRPLVFSSLEKAFDELKRKFTQALPQLEEEVNWYCTNGYHPDNNDLKSNLLGLKEQLNVDINEALFHYIDLRNLLNKYDKMVNGCDHDPYWLVVSCAELDQGPVYHEY